MFTHPGGTGMCKAVIELGRRRNNICNIKDMATTPFPHRGLYAVTDSALCRPRGLSESVQQAIEGGAAVVQYRDKSKNAPRRLQEATSLLDVCRQARVPLIINDDLRLARQIGADGIHIGQDDCTIAQARAALEPNSVIGVSCYGSLELALGAQAAGADYVAFGSFHPSMTKPGATPVDVALIRNRRQELQVPVVGIGGITPANAPPLIASGIDLVAVVSSLFAAPEPLIVARQFSRLF